MVEKYKKLGLSKRRIFQVIGISKSFYYYKERGGRRGSKASTETLHKSDGLVSNDRIVEIIKNLFENPYCDYGYFKTSKYLKNQGFIINHKKVNRIMKTHKLLHQRISRNKSGKEYIKYRKPKANAPCEQMQIDIKYIHVRGEHRNALLASVIDIYSREILGSLFAYSIRKYDVCKLIDEILSAHPKLMKATLRSDNGSQFEANLFRDYLKIKEISHEFTHPATPQENAYIESYHSIIERELCKKFEFDSFKEAKKEIFGYLKFYNEERLHSGIGYKSPKQFLQERELDGLGQLPSSTLL